MQDMSCEVGHGVRILRSSLLGLGYKLGFFGGLIVQGILALQFSPLRLMFWILSLGVLLVVMVLFRFL